LTEYLLATSDKKKYEEATKHPFLDAARKGTIDSDLLSFWLSQDRIYAAHGYPRFIGGLITKIPFLSQHKIGSVQETNNQRILSLLSFSLQNIVQEADFFQKSAQKYGLQIEGWKERAATRNYLAEMARVDSWGSLEEGLVFLWAMEKLYLDSWSFVASGILGQDKEDGKDSNAQRAVKDFARNWSNKEFIKFVDKLAELVDDLEIDPILETGRRIKVVWDRIVELEIEFWPDAEEVARMRKHPPSPYLSPDQVGRTPAAMTS
ncbi:heme oxygenase-like protein, partial [Cantharellus anzutake]|uniref:heme oxygenase-like protein n=1 Tax=Cantharellus anzutake TaxID=1750568 RepID=UPI0019046362